MEDVDEDGIGMILWKKQFQLADEYEREKSKASQEPAWRMISYVR